MLTLQWQDQPGAQLWQTLHTPSPLANRPVVIHLGLSSAAVGEAMQRLVDRIRALLVQMGAPATALPVPEALASGPADAFRLEAILGDGVTPVAAEPRLLQAAASFLDTVWALPLLPAEPANAASNTLPPELRRQHTAFWHGDAIEELALTVLARAGVTSLDRRVFISYRRVDTKPMADQLFDALSRLNYSVYLDTVSTHPGLDFQNQLFEHLADKSMVVVLQSASFQESQWTMAEVEFALRHNLSLLILRFPDAKDSLAGCRAGDQLMLERDDLDPNQGPPFALTSGALVRVVNRINRVHDLELVARRFDMHKRTLEALQRQGLNPLPHSGDVCLHIADALGQARFSLVPAERPPGFYDLHEASTRTTDRHGDQRVVVGNTGSLPAGRRRQMDWAVQGRNVRYCDVTMLDGLCQSIREELL
jgi:hypothetical protein